jgi:hypothetical protein
MMNGLAAIAAVLRTPAGFDAEQTAQLDPVGIEILPMDRLCPEQKIVERQIVKLFSFFEGPLVAAGLEIWGGGHGLFRCLGA